MNKLVILPTMAVVRLALRQSYSPETRVCLSDMYVDHKHPSVRTYYMAADNMDISRLRGVLYSEIIGLHLCDPDIQLLLEANLQAGKAINSALAPKKI